MDEGDDENEQKSNVHLWHYNPFSGFCLNWSFNTYIGKNTRREKRFFVVFFCPLVLFFRNYGGIYNFRQSLWVVNCKDSTLLCSLLDKWNS